MTVYYHVSTNLKHDGVFTPRVPRFRISKEEKHTPRICVAPSIEDCLTSMPDGGGTLQHLLERKNKRLKVFKIDTSKLNIDKESIISSKELFQRGFVPDAAATHETWITTNFQVPANDTQIIDVGSWDEKIKALVPYHIYQMAQQNWSLKNDIVGCHRYYYGKGLKGIVAIENLIYKKVS